MTLAQQTARHLGFHDDEPSSRAVRRGAGKLRRHTTIGLGPTYVMVAACYGTVWTNEAEGKFIIQRDGDEKVVDGVVQI